MLRRVTHSRAIILRVSGFRVFSNHLSKKFIVQGQTGIDLFEFIVLFFEFFESLQLPNIQPARFPTPLIEGCFTNIETSTDLFSRHPCISILHRLDNFRFAVCDFSHLVLPSSFDCAEPGDFSIVLFLGRGHPWVIQRFLSEFLNQTV